MTKLTEMDPAITANMGWDTKSASDDNLVTLVRHRMVLEEFVMTRKEFNKMNKKIKTGECCWSNDIEWKDAQWEDYCEEQTTYTAYPGDVTSFSDDCVAFLYPNAKWGDCSDVLKSASPDKFYSYVTV